MIAANVAVVVVSYAVRAMPRYDETPRGVGADRGAGAGVSAAEAVAPTVRVSLRRHLVGRSKELHPFRAVGDGRGPCGDRPRAVDTRKRNPSAGTLGVRSRQRARPPADGGVAQRESRAVERVERGGAGEGNPGPLGLTHVQHTAKIFRARRGRGEGSPPGERRGGWLQPGRWGCPVGRGGTAYAVFEVARGICIGIGIDIGIGGDGGSGGSTGGGGSVVGFALGRGYPLARGRRSVGGGRCGGVVVVTGEVLCSLSLAVSGRKLDSVFVSLSRSRVFGDSGAREPVGSW